MKHKCSFILKASIALVLTLLMLLGSIGSVIAATIDIRDTGADESGTAIGYDYLFVDFSQCTSRTFKGVDKFWGAAYTNKDGWVGSESCTDISGYIYKVPVSYYNRAFQILDSNDNKVNATVPSGGGKNWFKVNSSFNGGSWDTMPQYSLMNGTGNLSANSRLAFFSGSGSSYTTTVALSSGTTYNLYVFDNIDLKDWRASNTFTRSNTSRQIYNYGSMNNNTGHTFTLAADVTGDYVFGFPATNGGNFTVTYPALPAVTYNVTTSSYTNGSVTASPTSAAEGDTVTLTAEPNYGYALSSISVTKSGGGNVTLSGSGNTRTFTMPAANVSVSATFANKTDMNLYIAGRFHIYNGTSWVNSFDTGDWSNTGDDNIKFTWDSTAQKYKVDTGASPAELTDQISNINPYFFVYDKDNSKSWYATSTTTLTNSNTTVTLSKSSGANNNLRFNATSTDKPVTIWFDPTTGVLSYTIPTFYDVAVTSVTGGSVTASPSRCEAGTTVTLTASPSDGYELSSITAKKTGASTAVSLSGTGNTRTFTMPAYGVTVTPVWSKIDYTLTKNNTSHGSFKLTNASGTEISTAQVGDTVKVVPTPSTGYQTGTVARGTTSSLGTTISSNQFTMPASNQYVGVTFTEITGTARAKAYTSGSASSTGGTVKVGTGTAGATADATVGITTSKSITATKNTNYSLSGWQISGNNAAHLMYRFGTSGEWTAATKDATISNTTATIYIKTDGTSGITTSNAEVRALFVPTDYTGLLVGAAYTENNSTYTDFSPTPSGVTIAANHGTNQTGVAVSAPGTDPEGYQFYQWYSANGTFANNANKDTTFKPNATGAKAIARYKKIFTITSSVDASGTGAGTVSTDKQTVEAGGSYNITATPGSHSAIESIIVNNGTATTTSPKNVTAVSANQNVVVKFKSKVLLKGTSPINTTEWAGVEMKSNAAGTSFTKADIVLEAGETYQFRLYADDAWKANSVTTWDIDGVATHSTSGDNLTITPTVKAKVTFVSDGTKFTSISAIPYDSTTYNVTLKKVAGSTITATYHGTEYTTASADAVVPVYSGTEINFTVTADSGKYLSGLTTSAGSLSPAFAVGDSYTGKISNVTSARTVTPTVANKLAVTAKTNKSSRGTVSVSPASARPSQTVTITVSPKAGILQTLTYEYAGGKKYERNFTANCWDEVTASTGAAAAPALSKDMGLATTGAAVPELAPMGADATYTFTLDSNPTGAVTVNATFAPYSGESNWYYNGYDNSGNKVTAYWGKQMTEGMVSGEKFSYYHVEGRTGSDQLFTVSDGLVADTRYVYFTRPHNYGDGWSNSNTPMAHFWKNGGSDYDTWPGNEMTWVYNNDMGQGVFKIAIPVGADRVSFNDASNNGQHQTLDIDLTNTSGAYYVGEWNDGEQKYNYGTWNTGYADQGYIVSGTEYFYDSERYTADYSTKGFFNHFTSSKDYTKPKDLGTSTGDYYVNVLYAGKTYTINGVTKTVGAKELVIWTTEPLNDDGDTVTVYAKDGAIRSESFGSTYANIADTQIVASASSTTSIGTSHNGNISGQTYETYKAGKGETIYIRTTINTTAGNGADTTTNRNKYYVRGFCINGEVFELKTWDSSGVYTTSYKIPEDYESKYVEITPIYYLKDTTAHPIVTYRVTGFTDELKEVGAGKPGWGDTLYTYPFYGKLGSQNNALGAYPGQPMVYYKGQYQMQIPQKSTAWDVYYSDSNLSGSNNTEKATNLANTNVSGVTMSNGYYDSVHRLIMGYGNNGSSSDHVQTYDYGDFYKIFNEKAPVDNIVFDFKYETKKHNFENQPDASVTKSTLDTNYGTNGNGFEILTNFHGRHVDLFGTPLSGDAADPEKTTPVYVISIGGVNGSAGVENIAGYYATEWMVYGSSNGTDYTRITGGDKNSIPPEVLVLNDDDNTSFNTSTYPSADANHTITDWKALYTALEAYRGKPVMISYEAADAQIGSGNYATSGGGGATRNDGRWLYSKNGETITSKIRIDVSEDNGVTYTENPASGATGHIDNLDAFFTNAEADGETTYTTTIDPDKTFDFEAHSNNADYKFMGWYMDDGTKITLDNVGHTERSGSYTFVARFMRFTGGQLILGHKAAKGSVDGNSYQGDGTATIAVTVKNGDEVVREIAASSSDVTLDDRIINNEHTAYTITVTLNAAPSGEDTYARTKCDQANTFFGGQSTYTSMPQTFTFTVGSLFTSNEQTTKKITYNSYFDKVLYTYKYTFNFTARDGSNKSYVREGTLTAAQRQAYVSVTGDESRVLSEGFVNNLAPHESNFNQSLKWNITATDRTFTKDGVNYTLTKSLTAVEFTEYKKDDQGHETSEPVRSTKRKATFILPYAHTNGVPSNIMIMDEAPSTNHVINNLDYGALVAGKNGEENVYVVAPRQLNVNENDSIVTKNFQYWSVKSTKAAGENDPDVARCYFYSFNLIAYDNYIITPVYGEGASPLNEGSSDPITTISYLETSRNQYNNDGSTSSDRAKAADILYNDFVMSFNYNGIDIYKNDASSAEITEIGYVIERVQKLEVQQDGTPYTDPSHYSAVNVKTDEEIKTFAAGSATSSGTLSKHTIAKDQLDNKNRIEFYQAYYNSGGWNNETQSPVSTYGYKNYVYKAYTYMIVGGVVSLSDPAYFTMYDEATK